MNEGYTILLVENDENDAFLVRRALQKCGITNPVRWLKDGAEAIAYLAGKEPWADRTANPFPEVIVLDLKMPRMSGLDVLAWLREHREFQVIPTIVMSSSGHESDVRRAYQLGANTFFVKPTEFDSLASLIEKVHAYWEMSARPTTRPDLPIDETGD